MATTRERLNQLLAETDAIFEDAFMTFVQTVQSDAVMAEIISRLESNDLEGALEIIRQHTASFAQQAVPMAIQTAGREAMAEALAVIGRNSLSVAFDPTHPRAAEIMRQETLGLIREFTDKQIEATRYALTEAFISGQGNIAASRAFRDSIGLTRSQLKAVGNYRRLLSIGHRDALERALRDRRFDRTVERAVNGSRPLMLDEIDRMVDRYRRRYLAHRAQTIAVTESGRATSIAREEAFDQISEKTGLGPRMERIWNSTHDKRVREWHDGMDQQTSPLGGTFTDGLGNILRFPHDPHAPPETVINCRCVLTMRIRPKG